MAALLDYMYSGEADVARDRLPCLIRAAEYLQIKGLAADDNPLLQEPQSAKVRGGYRCRVPADQGLGCR